MNNFIYHNPTELVFGKGQIARLSKLIPADRRIMITFGLSLIHISEPTRP